MSDWVDVGSRVFYKTHTCSHRDGPSGALVRFGGELEDEGYDRDGICVGGISWCPDCSGPTWELRSLDPLHVEPSIQTNCPDHPKHHGWIRDGRWENASDGYLPPEPAATADTSTVNETQTIGPENVGPLPAEVEGDGAGAVVHRNTPMLIVEILPDTHARIEGVEVLPGEQAQVDGMCAIGLVSGGYAKIVGSVDPATGEQA